MTPSGNEDLHAREPAAEGIDGRLGGEGAQEDRAVEGGLAVGIRQPGVQRRHGGVEDEADHDEVDGGGRVVDVQRLKAQPLPGALQCSTMPASRSTPPAMCTSR